MRKLFIHHPLFRLLSPVFSGVIVYLLILLVQNNVEQLKDTFLGEELYICIGLSYVVQELSRALLILFQKFHNAQAPKMILIQVFTAMLLCVTIITALVMLYFKYVIGYSANSEILWVFNSIFCSITFIYIVLHLSHHYLYKINSDKIQVEQLLKQDVEDDFMQFKKGINTELLFESFEALIVLIRQNKDNTDDFLDHIATVYRYILSKRQKQLVSIQEETDILKELILLFNYLPYRNVLLNSEVNSNFLVVPGSLLVIVEHIVKSTINSPNYQLKIDLSESTELLQIQYEFNDRIEHHFNLATLKDVRGVYNVYSKTDLSINEKDGSRQIVIPKLIINT